jgi:hypothetical protein
MARAFNCHRRDGLSLRGCRAVNDLVSMARAFGFGTDNGFCLPAVIAELAEFT